MLVDNTSADLLRIPACRIDNTADRRCAVDNNHPSGNADPPQSFHDHLNQRRHNDVGPVLSGVGGIVGHRLRRPEHNTTLFRDDIHHPAGIGERVLAGAVHRDLLAVHGVNVGGDGMVSGIGRKGIVNRLRMALSYCPIFALSRYWTIAVVWCSGDMKTIHDPRYKELIERLVALRKQKGITQEQLATRLGRLRTYVVKIEHADCKIDILLLHDWIRALDSDPSEILSSLTWW